MDDEFILNNDNLISYSIRRDIFNNTEFIILSINTNDGFFKYKIFKDERERDLERIEIDLNEAFSGLRNLTINRLEISYWKTRIYLYITSYSNEGDASKQYTAHKLPMDFLDFFNMFLLGLLKLFKPKT